MIWDSRVPSLTERGQPPTLWATVEVKVFLGSPAGWASNAQNHQGFPVSPSGQHIPAAGVCAGDQRKPGWRETAAALRAPDTFRAPQEAVPPEPRPQTNCCLRALPQTHLRPKECPGGGPGLPLPASHCAC